MAVSAPPTVGTSTWGGRLAKATIDSRDHGRISDADWLHSRVIDDTQSRPADRLCLFSPAGHVCGREYDWRTTIHLLQGQWPVLPRELSRRRARDQCQNRYSRSRARRHRHSSTSQSVRDHAHTDKPTERVGRHHRSAWRHHMRRLSKWGDFAIAIRPNGQ